MSSKAFPFICYVESYDSADGIWELFDEELENQLYWTQGHKYWRLKPELDEKIDFETNQKIYRIYSRILATEKPIKKLKEIKHGYPYDDEEDITKFEPKYVTVGEIPEFVGKI